MREVFQCYEHYGKWIWENWHEKTRELDELIIQSKLMVEIDINCTGESYRILTKEEFKKMESNGYISSL